MIALCLSAAGCGGGATDALPREPVYGAVSLDGKPLEGGTVEFDPQPGNAVPISATGIISGGSFKIARADGPTPGKYRVAIREVVAATAPTSEAPGAPPKRAAKSKPLVPEKYNAKTELTFEVTAGGDNHRDFELKSK